MTTSSNVVPLGAVLAAIDARSRVIAGDDSRLGLPISRAAVILESHDVPSDPSTLLICPGIRTTADLSTFVAGLSENQIHILLLAPPESLPADEVRGIVRENIVVVEFLGHDVADIVVSVARATEPAEESVSRRLSAVQRSLSQALTAEDPTTAVLLRLKKICNATIAVVDKHGKSSHTTGPIPLTLLFGEISKTAADSQMIDVDGWHGVAVRMMDPNHTDDSLGWLIATARRAGFPDVHSTAAVYVAATLVEASQQMAMVSRQQEHAIRSAVLEEALALRPDWHSSELSGRISAFGISFEEEARVVVLRTDDRRSARSRDNIGDLAELVIKALGKDTVPYLATRRDQALTCLVQISTPAFKRLIVSQDLRIPNLHIGIGRAAHSVGDISDSYRDAELAVRTISRSSRGPSVMAYEEFDYATRLFADIGLDKMAAWAIEFIRPLEGRDPLLEGLRVYFENNQNINAAAEQLSIHHNSLRYRLSQVEKLLGIVLRAPASISSIFLALTALDLAGLQRKTSGTATEPEGWILPDNASASGTATQFESGRISNPGVAHGPDR